MAKTVKIPDPVYATAEDIANEQDMSIKEAIRQIWREAGYETG